MSAIDTLTHAHVASFFGLPVYWVVGEGKVDDVALGEGVLNRTNLVVGGGSGEHPALIINNDAVVAQFLMRYANTDYETTNPVSMDDQKMIVMVEQLADRSYDDLRDWQIDQNQWPIETFARIINEVEGVEPYARDAREGIQNGMAYFIMNELPAKHALRDPLLRECVTMFKAHQCTHVFNDIPYGVMEGFAGLLRSQRHGKIIRDNRAHWGYGLEEVLADLDQGIV